MRGQLRVDAIYAYLAVDDDGTEGIPAVNGAGVALPMVGADMERMHALRSYAARLAEASHRPIELVRFSDRQHLEWLGGKPIPRPEPKPPAQRIPFRTFDAAMLQEQDLAVADGVVVAGAIVEGKPATVLVFTFGKPDGTHDELAIALTGQQAADLVPLTRDAWEAAKASQS